MDSLHKVPNIYTEKCLNLTRNQYKRKLQTSSQPHEVDVNNNNSNTTSRRQLKYNIKLSLPSDMIAKLKGRQTLHRTSIYKSHCVYCRLQMTYIMPFSYLVNDMGNKIAPLTHFTFLIYNIKTYTNNGSNNTQCINNNRIAALEWTVAEAGEGDFN